MKSIIKLIAIWLFVLLIVYSFFVVIDLALKTVKESDSNIQYVEVEKNKPIEYQWFEVTAYTSGIESTGKTSGDPLFGITASGEVVLERTTIACPESLEFGTRIYIPDFETVFICQDRGSDIVEGRLDVYMEDLQHALLFGRQHMQALILPEGANNDKFR